MGSLLKIDDIENALGREVADATEEKKWQHYIDVISAFINAYVSVSFELKTDDTVRLQADYYGVINLGGDPVSSVSTVKDWQTGSAVRFGYNGLNQLFDLEPEQVVDVTYSHGYVDVPDDIRYLATEAVLGILGLASAGPLKALTVGDITETYASQRGGVNVSLAADVLDKYASLESTYHLGTGRYPGYATTSQQIPLL